MVIHNRQDCYTFTAALARGKRGIDETLPFIDRVFLTQRVGQLGENLAQHFTLTPLLKSAMDRLVVGVALGEQVPLCTGVQNPEDRFQHRLCGDGLMPWPGIEMCSSEKCSRIRPNWSSRSHSMRARGHNFRKSRSSMSFIKSSRNSNLHRRQKLIPHQHVSNTVLRCPSWDHLTEIFLTLLNAEILRRRRWNRTSSSSSSLHKADWPVS
jgi:hypothetical protein